MVVKVDNSHDSNKYRLQRIAGRNIIERCPVFSPDGESLAVIVENIVRVYNVRTGDIVRILETESEINELVAIEFPEKEDYNLVGCSVDGCLTKWTWDNGVVLRETKLNIPNKCKIRTFNLIDSNDCFITANGGNYLKHIHKGAYSMKTGNLLQEYLGYNIWTTQMIKVAMGWCNGDKYAAIINGTRMLYIQSIYQPHCGNVIPSLSGYRITSIAAHQHASAMAITDTLGRINIIRGDLYDKRAVVKEILHWHFLPPFALCFSEQGNYLYSGGMEAVVVKWTLGNLAYKANEKSFIPRLPGLVRYITTNNTHVAITLSNNSIILANPQLRVVSTILECGGMPPLVRAIGSTFLYHHQLGALLIHGRTGHLQLYSTTSNKVMYDIDITEMNRIQPERWNLLPLETEVTCASLSPDGTTLVTSEYRNDGVIYPEEKLKFWTTEKQNLVQKPFKLKTCVNFSHSGCRVISIALNNKGDMCVTAGMDQKFRIWTLEKGQKGFSWFCLTACYYSSGSTQALSLGMLNDFKLNERNYTSVLPYMVDACKDDIIVKAFNSHKNDALVDGNLFSYNINSENELGCVAISSDGSLIAAWFGCKLSLWDTHLCSMRTTLSHPALMAKGLQVEFGNQDAAHYLVCTTENCLAVWSLLSLTLKWLVQMNPVCLTSDALSNKMAVVTKNNDVYVFSPHSSEPILVQKNILDPKKGVFKRCTFGSSTSNSIKLYLMRNDAEIYSIEPEQKSSENRLEVISHRNAPSSKFNALMAEQQVSEVRHATPTTMPLSGTEALASAAIAQICQAPPHMVPPVSLLSTSFLQELSGQVQPKEEEETLQEDSMEIQDSSEEDEAGDPKLNGPYAPKITELWTPNYDAVKEKKLNKIMKEPFLDLHSSVMLFGDRV